MTQHNPFPSSPTSAHPSSTPASFLRVTAAAVGAAIIQIALFIYYGLVLNAWQLIVVAAILFALGIISGFSLRLIQRGEKEAGTWPVLIAVSLGIFSIAALVEGVSIILAVMLVIINLIIGSQTLPTRKLMPLFLGSLVPAAITASLDYLGLDYRLYLPALQNILAGAAVIFLLVIFYFVIPQFAGQIKSLQVKITVWTGSVVVGVLLALVIYTTITGRQAAIQSAENEALAIASAEAGQIRADAEIPLDMARTLAQSLTALKNPENDLALTRDQVNALLRQVLQENPTYLGTYTLWEPDAFDGRDIQYANTEAHDASGRFIPYWVRGDDGNLSVIALQDYETPGIGDWYILPRQTRKEVTVAPLIYPINGKDTVMASFVAPIIYKGTFYGIAGVDAPIGFVQNIVDGINLYDGTAQAILMTSEGVLIGVRNQPELVNRPATAIFQDFADFQTRIADGEAFINTSPDGKFLRVFAPVDLGQTGKHWAFALVIPLAKITAAATAAAIQQGLIGIGLILAALTLLWLLIGQVVRPMRELTAVATAVSQGNLNVQANIQAVDETGILANTFNTMILQLQGLFATLEQRVADRTRNLELAAEVGRSISQVRDLKLMLTDAAEIIRSRFDLYYTQVYLTNSAQNALVLQAGTGNVGVELLNRNHRLPINTGSINGRAVIEKNSVVISDTTASTTFRPNPLLPNTRSEMAVPLIIGENVIGVLDMQSQKPGALSPEVLPAFEALAGQLAIAIQNANLLDETEKARAEVEAQARRLVHSSWSDHQDALHNPENTGFVFENNQVQLLDEHTAEIESENALSAPIAVTGQPIGQIAVELTPEQQSEQSQELVTIIANQVARHVENLRLIETAERYRSESEEAARRLTIEGWQEYFTKKQEQPTGFFYDLKQVKPVAAGAIPGEAAFSLPLKVRDETLGTISVLNLEDVEPETLEMAEAISQRLSAHIESLRLLEETQLGQIELNKRARQLAAVSEISTVSSRELDIQKMLATVVQMTQRQFGLYHAHVFTFNEAAQHLEIVACGWQEGDVHEGTHGTTTIPLNQEQSLVARAARTRQPVVVNNVHNDPGWLPNAMLPNTAAELAVPLVIGEEVLGVMDVQSEHLDAFSEEDISIQITLAAQVATALQNARSYARARRQAEREAMLNTISQKIQSATSVEAVLQIAARELGHALGAPRTIAQLSLKEKK